MAYAKWKVTFLFLLLVSSILSNWITSNLTRSLNAFVIWRKEKSRNSSQFLVASSGEICQYLMFLWCASVLFLCHGIRLQKMNTFRFHGWKVNKFCVVLQKLLNMQKTNILLWISLFKYFCTAPWYIKFKHSEQWILLNKNLNYILFFSS